jgi:hypothetical protein
MILLNYIVQIFDLPDLDQPESGSASHDQHQLQAPP